MIHFDIFTLFPGMFAGVLDDSILKRAREAGILSVALHNIRDYAEGRHRITDDTPYGGGGGMVMKPDPIFRAVETVLSHEAGWQWGAGAPPEAAEPSAPADAAGPALLPEGAGSTGPEACGSAALGDAAGPARLLADVPIILLSPQGRPFTQAVAEELAGRARLALICGRYEGVDERVRTGLVTDEISIGDFVISGGELAAAIIVDAVTRLQPGALGCAMGALEDSFATGLLEYPQYTRPAAYRGEGIPEILTSGDHARVARWRREQALRRTWERRPDLLDSAPLSAADRAYLASLENDTP